ncbi:MAG: hypothetical protein C5B50_20365, partial [Verrucomicrobia bacterium]
GGGGGGSGGYAGSGGGGGGGGSIIDSSAITVIAEFSSVASPDGSPNGEIIISAVPEPKVFNLLTASFACFALWRCCSGRSSGPPWDGFWDGSDINNRSVPPGLGRWDG